MPDTQNGGGQKEVEATCRQIYAEVASFYQSKISNMGETARGYSILYGPPIRGAETLFVGFQPGDDRDDAVIQETWPASCLYATDKWRLAVRMRQIWSESYLRRCTGLNAIFFRAASVVQWRTLPRDLRNEMEAFSLTRTDALIQMLEPERIIVLGLWLFDRLTHGSNELLGQTERVLVKRGAVCGHPALGIVHLSGSRVSTPDMACLKTYLTS